MKQVNTFLKDYGLFYLREHATPGTTKRMLGQIKKMKNTEGEEKERIRENIVKDFYRYGSLAVEDTEQLLQYVGHLDKRKYFDKKGLYKLSVYRSAGENRASFYVRIPYKRLRNAEKENGMTNRELENFYLEVVPNIADIKEKVKKNRPININPTKRIFNIGNFTDIQIRAVSITMEKQMSQVGEDLSRKISTTYFDTKLLECIEKDLKEEKRKLSSRWVKQYRGWIEPFIQSAKK